VRLSKIVIWDIDMEEENKLVIDRETAKEASQKTVVSNESNERCKIHIGNDVYVVANTFKDRLLIHIRQYDRCGNDLYPTKKGLVLTLSRWSMLEGYTDFI